MLLRGLRTSGHKAARPCDGPARMSCAGQPPHEVVVDPATQQTLVTGLSWAPVHAASDLAAAVARCHAASEGGEATTVLTLHVTSGPAAALAARFDAASAQVGHPGGSAADGQHRRGSATRWSGVATSKLTFVCVAAASAEEATATTAGRRGLSNLRSRVMGDGAAPSSGDEPTCSCRLSFAEVHDHHAEKPKFRAPANVRATAKAGKGQQLLGLLCMQVKDRRPGAAARAVPALE